MSNAGPGLSPNKQSQSGKVAATNVRGETISPNYIERSDDGRKRGGMPAGSLSAAATGMPQNTSGGKVNGFFKTSSKQPHAPIRPLGTAASSHGQRGEEATDLMRGKSPPRGK